MKKYLPVVFFVLAFTAFLYVFSDDTAKNSAQNITERLGKMEAEIGEMSDRLQKVERDVRSVENDGRQYEAMISKVIDNEDRMLKEMRSMNNLYQELNQY